MHGARCHVDVGDLPCHRLECRKWTAELRTRADVPDGQIQRAREQSVAPGERSGQREPAQNGRRLAAIEEIRLGNEDAVQAHGRFRRSGGVPGRGQGDARGAGIDQEYAGTAGHRYRRQDPLGA